MKKSFARMCCAIWVAVFANLTWATIALALGFGTWPWGDPPPWPLAFIWFVLKVIGIGVYDAIEGA